MAIEDRLKDFARSIGIDLIGITTADPFEGAFQRLERMKALGYLSPWAEQDALKRCNPRVLMEDAQSLIAVGMCYPSIETSGRDSDSDYGRHECFTGKLARFASCADYHLILRKKLEELVAFIRKTYPDVKAQIFVDTGPLLEREVAERAGLGFIGKNAALINPEYGSFLALGEILLDITLQPDQSLGNGCGDCDLCLNACPQQAIKAPGEIDSKRCLAHYTQEKGYLDQAVCARLGNRLWGCDTCQEVCPFNRPRQCGGDATRDKVVVEGNKCRSIWPVLALGVRPDLAKILALSNKDYQKLIGETAMAWRGKTVLQRNSLINLGNQRDPRAIPIVQTALNDVRPVLRVTAVWALHRIGGEEATRLIEQALKGERDEEVRGEMLKVCKS